MLTVTLSLVFCVSSACALQACLNKNTYSPDKCDELLRMKFVTVDLDMEDFDADADLGSDADVDADAGPGAPDSHEDEDEDESSAEAPSHRSRWWVESYAVKRSGEVEYYVVFEDLGEDDSMPHDVQGMRLLLRDSLLVL